jgi:S-adenosylmethionine decarboxylase
MVKTARAGPTSQPYGMQLLLDGYGADPNKLGDVGLLYKTLNALPDEIGMTKIGFPQIVQFTTQPIAGISGFIFIVESHISVHTYSEQRFISVDVYSCKPFEPKTVVQLLKGVYAIKKVESQVIARGKSFKP